MNLRPKFEPYINAQGLVSPDGSISQNDVRFTATSMVICKMYGDWELYSFFFRNMMRREKDGILTRADDNDEQDSWDNYVPFLDVMAGTSAAQRIRWHGVTHLGSWKNRGHGKFGSHMLIRHPGFMFHTRVCGEPNGITKKILSLPYRVAEYPAWRIHMWAATHYSKYSQDGWVLTAHMLRAALRRYPQLKPVQDSWEEMLKIYWPCGLGQIHHKYFALPDNEMHPISELLWDVYTL